jgi:hypothetical protein
MSFVICPLSFVIGEIWPRTNDKGQMTKDVLCQGSHANACGAWKKFCAGELSGLASKAGRQEGRRLLVFLAPNI